MSDSYVPSQRQQEREAYRRSRSRRSMLVAGSTTVLVLVAAGLLITSAPGWPPFRQSFLNAHYAREALPEVLHGLLLNLRLMVLCEICILALGLTLAVMRTLRGPVAFPLRLFAAVYTDLFRGIPLLLVLLLLGLGIPALALTGVTDSVVFWGGVALVLTYSAYVAEVFRAGIESVHPSQRLAARSLGLTYGQTLRLIVLPQGVRRVIPALMNDFVSMQKDVGLISILGVVDAISAANIQKAISYNYTAFVIAGLLFILLSLPFVQITNHLERRAVARQQQGALV